MIWKSKDELGPGEARNRARLMRQAGYFEIAVGVGLVIGLVTGIFDQGDGNLFAADWDKMKLLPAMAMALAVAALLFGGFMVLHARGFTPPRHAFGIFAIAYAAMLLSSLYARWWL